MPELRILDGVSNYHLMQVDPIQSKRTDVPYGEEPSDNAWTRCTADVKAVNLVTRSSMNLSIRTVSGTVPSQYKTSLLAD
jgi:hypothetical protein